MRAAIVVAVACLSAAGLCAGQDAQAAIKKQTNIPAQELVPALKMLAHERGFQVAFLAEVVGNKRTQGAVGELTTTEALTKLLEGTNLVYSYLDDKTVMILPANTATSSDNSDGKGTVDSDSNKSSTPTTVLEEVIVTAQKRAERLQDVPIPISVANTEALTQSNQVLLQDYYSQLPGLNLTVGGLAQTALVSIRGIQSSTGGAPSVGIVIDDVPFGSATGLGSRGQPDIDPGDLARIEVLRGPQGTLYGAASMGGLVKFVTIDPSTEGVSGRVEGGATSLSNGMGPGYDFRGSVNIPVNTTAAFRASAFRQVDGGYIDNIQTRT